MGYFKDHKIEGPKFFIILYTYYTLYEPLYFFFLLITPHFSFHIFRRGQAYYAQINKLN